MQRLVSVQKKGQKQKKGVPVDDELLQSLKRTLEDLKAGRVREV